MALVEAAVEAPGVGHGPLTGLADRLMRAAAYHEHQLTVQEFVQSAEAILPFL